MKPGLNTINGKISNLQYSLEDRRTTSGEFERNARLYSPILAALSGNGGMAVAGMSINSYYPFVKGKVYWVKMDIDGKPFKGWLGGIFFKEEDEVDIIIKEDEIIAVHNSAKQIIAFDPFYGNGLNLKAEYKSIRYVFIASFLFLLLFCIIVLIFVTATFKEFINMFLFAIPVIAVCSLLFSFGTNRIGFFQALRKQKAILALGLSKNQPLEQKIYDDDSKFDKEQEMAGALYRY